ncbi:hypothetical protein Bbelb_203780 [Branchiostoma belcheri]|nr:hypothetical protein Bbelb_203780 [Branchiostoma belcheri]
MTDPLVALRDQQHGNLRDQQHYGLAEYNTSSTIRRRNCLPDDRLRISVKSSKGVLNTKSGPCDASVDRSAHRLAWRQTVAKVSAPGPTCPRGHFTIDTPQLDPEHQGRPEHPQAGPLRRVTRLLQGLDAPHRPTTLDSSPGQEDLATPLLQGLPCPPDDQCRSWD